MKRSFDLFAVLLVYFAAVTLSVFDPPWYIWMGTMFVVAFFAFALIDAYADDRADRKNKSKSSVTIDTRRY